MILIREIGIKKFRNIKQLALTDLRDLNILIGPNNCGKTNILEFLNRFSQLSEGRVNSYICTDCDRFMNSTDKLTLSVLFMNRSQSVHM